MISTNTSVVVERESLELTPNLQLYGSIFLQRESLCFPALGWRDFVSVLLEWWLRALTPILSQQKDKAKLLFMEGPYEVDVRAVSPTTVTLWGLDRAHPEDRIAECINEEDVFEFVDSIQLASRLVICKSRELQLANRDFDRLIKVLAEVERVVAARKAK